MLKSFRVLKILHVAARHGLDEMLATSLGKPRLHWVSLLSALIGLIYFWRDIASPRGERLRRALQELGPIFVKFGQVLSTRRDLVPADMIADLAHLQDRVPPFPADRAIAQIQQSLKAHPDDLFAQFDHEPMASASIAQVHFATLKNGQEVVVKVLRPNVKQSIDNDVALMRTAALWIEKLWSEGRRLKARDVVSEFDKHLHDELDLMREAANGSQLRRTFLDSPLLIVPEMFWDYCSSSVIVMERMKGIPISHTERLKEAGVDLKKLARDGVEIFFTQVFRDGFFHADMHPGNIFVSVDPTTFGRYIALDFGIVGTLNDFDKDYLSQNFLGFFQRDYRRVAIAHVESGWAPPETRVDELESAVRACCEPIFDRPLKDISFGQVLLRLFQTSRRFNIEVQPQLVLLQKTLLNVEGLGRELDPELDLWKTAKPHLERWMNAQTGWRGLIEQLKLEIPTYSRLLPQLPRLAHLALSQATDAQHAQHPLLDKLLLNQTRTHRLLTLILCIGVGLVGVVGVLLYWSMGR